MHGLREAPVQSWRGETATSVAKLYICEVTRLGCRASASWLAARRVQLHLQTRAAVRDEAKEADLPLRTTGLLSTHPLLRLTSLLLRFEWNLIT